MNKHVLRGLALAGALGASAMAHADSTAATTAITAAQTDAMAVAAALLTLGVAVWGANYIRRKFFGG